MKKLFKVITLSVMVLSLVVIGNAATSKAASRKANDAYKKFVDQLKTDSKNKDNIYTATMKAGKGEDVLLVSYNVFDYKGKKAISAKAYQYVNQKVKYIGAFHSNGTDYALSKSGKYLIINTLHSTEKVLFCNGKATTCKYDGIYLDKKFVKQTQYKIQNNKRTLTSSKKVSSKKAEKQVENNFKANEIIFK